MEFTYSSSISRFVKRCSMVSAMNTSATLRSTVCSCVKYWFFASCCVMVLPPSTIAPALRSFTRARPVAMTSKPGWA